MNRFLIIILFLFSATCFAQPPIYNEIKNTLYSKWITKYPELKETKPSYFNKSKAKKYFIAPLQISGRNIPFTWDSDLSILTFLMGEDAEFSVKKGLLADKIFHGIKINWVKSKSALIWLQNKVYETSISNWYLFGANDCPGTHLFPLLNFEKVVNLDDARINRLRGLVIFPFNKEIKGIVQTMAELKTTKGKTLKGKGFDLNEDKILDVFIYYEPLDPESMTGYRRLYLNIDGRWTGKWSEYFEECI